MKIKNWHQFSIFDFKQKLNGRMIQGSFTVTYKKPMNGGCDAVICNSWTHATCPVAKSPVFNAMLGSLDRSIQQVPVKRHRSLRIQWIPFIINNKIALRAHNENLVLKFHIKTQFQIRDFYERKTLVNKKLISFWVSVNVDGSLCLWQEVFPELEKKYQSFRW